MKKQLTENQKKHLKKAIQKFQLPGGQVVVYCIVNKQSKSGLTTNQRVVLMHAGQKSIRYYSKPPPGIPFTKPEQIIQGKQKVYIKQVSNFKANALKGKTSTVQISWMVGKQKVSWIFAFGSSKMMYEWLAALDQMNKQKLTLDKVPKQQQKKTNIAQSQASQILQPPPLNPHQQMLYRQANKKQPSKFGDVASEIQHLRQSNYPKFILSNQIDDNKQKQSNKPKTSPKNVNTSKVSPKNISKVSPKNIESKQSIKNNESNKLQKNASSRSKQLTQIIQRPQETKADKYFNSKPKTQYKPNQSITKKAQSQNYSNQSEKSQTMNKNLTTYYNNKYNNKQDIQRSKSFQNNPKKLQQSKIASEINFRGNHLNKTTSKKPLAPSRQWNQIWWTSSTPYIVYQQFIQQVESKAKNIIDELPLDDHQKQYIPIRANPPHFMYYQNGIQYHMHHFVQGRNILQQNMNSENAPLLYDHLSYTQFKRQFYNFNLLMTATGNKSIFKVPLCCYIQYKGILIICKASTPQRFQKLEPYQCEKQIQALQDSLKIRFIFESMVLYRHPAGKYVIIDTLSQLIPRIQSKIYPPAYFRAQMFLHNQTMIDDKSSIDKLNAKLINELIPQYIQQMQHFQSWVICSKDFRNGLHKMGISLGCLTDIYEQTDFIYLKKIIISEIVCQIFQQILRSQLNNAFENFPIQDLQQVSLDSINNLEIQCIYIMINQLFSYSVRSQDIWRAIVLQANSKYNIVISKQDVIPGYLLGGITSGFGIICDFKAEQFNRENTLFIKQNCIPKSIFIRMQPKIRRYDLSTASEQIQKIQEILDNQPLPQNFQDLVRILNLKNQQIPPYLCQRKDQILLYLCNFVALGQHDDFQHLGLYESLQEQPHTYVTTKTSLLGIKWSIKGKNQELANKIFQHKFQENSFWVGEFNPAITQFYDFFAVYHSSINNYDQAIKFAKSSLINIIKLYGTNALPTADKHYQLGNIFFRTGKKQEALKQFARTKQILQAFNQIKIPQYGVILLKLSVLYLNFGKISECVSCALEAIKVFDISQDNQNDQIETFQILVRAYQITRNYSDMMSVGSVCMQKFNNSENFKNFQRMVKIVLLPKLILLNSQDAKKMLKIFDKLQQIQSQITSSQAFTFLHRKSNDQVIMKRVLIFIDNIQQLYDDVHRRDLYRNHRSLEYQPQLQASEMLVYFEAIAKVTGFGFIIGSLKEVCQ